MSDMYDKKTRVPHGQLHVVRADGSLDVGSVNDEPTMTQQQWKDDCDVNHILKRYSTTGEIFHLNRKAGVYADLSMITDYQDMLHTVQHAQEAFMTLPAEIRSRFENDPNKLIQFLNDPKNIEEGIQLGILEKNADPTPINKNDRNDIIPGVTKAPNNPTPVPDSKSSTPAPQA